MDQVTPWISTPPASPASIELSKPAGNNASKGTDKKTTDKGSDILLSPTQKAKPLTPVRISNPEKDNLEKAAEILSAQPSGVINFALGNPLAIHRKGEGLEAKYYSFIEYYWKKGDHCRDCCDIRGRTIFPAFLRVAVFRYFINRGMDVDRLMKIAMEDIISDIQSLLKNTSRLDMPKISNELAKKQELLKLIRDDFIFKKSSLAISMIDKVLNSDLYNNKDVVEQIEKILNTLRTTEDFFSFQKNYFLKN